MDIWDVSYNLLTNGAEVDIIAHTVCYTWAGILAGLNRKIGIAD